MRITPESITPESLEDEFSLKTAATRLDFLSRRDDGSTTPDAVLAAVDDVDDWSGIRAAGTRLDVPEALELLALGEVIARKAHRSRLTGIRAALRGGAGWEQIAAALDVAPGEAWDVYVRVLDGAGLDPDADAAARRLAGPRP